MKRNDTTVGSRRVDQAQLRKNIQRKSPQVTALMRNMVRDEADPSRNTADRERRVKYDKLKSLSDIIANNTNAATDLRQITPYIAKAELIWKTLLLYPNGPQDNILTYDNYDTPFKNTKLYSELCIALQRYITNNYKIEERLPKMVSEMVCGSGAYIEISLSRPALDHIINGQQRFGESTGNESHSMRVEIDKEFVRKEFDINKKRVTRFMARNKGFIVNPNTRNTNVSGLESLYGDNVRENAGEEFFILEPDWGITVTDNPSVLALGEIKNNNRRDVANSVMGVESLASVVRKSRAANKDGTLQTESSLKGAGKRNKATPSAVNTTVLTDGQLEALQQDLYPHRNYVRQQTASIRLSEVYNIKPFGIPLSLRPSSEGFIPVHLDGDPTKQVGGFLLIDSQTGELLKSTKDSTFNQSIKKQGDKIDTPNQQGSNNNLIANLRRIQEGNECDFDMSEFALLAKDQIEKALVQAASSSANGGNISVSLEQNALHIYLSRAFKQQGVRTLFIPAECYTYFAFNYNRLGIGQSLTTRAKMFIARLAALDVADAIANLNQAQTLNQLTVDLEEEDPDPENTIEISRGKWFQSNPTLHTIVSAGSLSVPDIVEALRQQSLIVKVNANNNPFIPAPQVDIQQIERSGFKSIDDASRQNLLSSIASTYMLQRSWLDDKEDGNNFQVEALAEQEMLRNQTVLWGASLGLQVTDCIRKYAAVNEVLLNELIEIIDANKGMQKPDGKDAKIEVGEDQDITEVILADFLNSLKITLPQPASIESTQKLKDKINAVNDLVQGWIDMSGGIAMMTQMLQSAGIETEGMSPDEISAKLKGVFLIDLYKRMNLPMPFDAVADKGKGGGLFSILNDIDQFSENIGLFLIEMAKGDKKRSEKMKKALDKILGVDDNPEGGEFPNGDENPNPDDNPGDETEGSGLDDNDFDINNNIPGGDDDATPPEDDTPVGEEGQTQGQEDNPSGELDDKDFNANVEIPE